MLQIYLEFTERCEYICNMLVTQRQNNAFFLEHANNERKKVTRPPATCNL